MWNKRVTVSLERRFEAVFLCCFQTIYSVFEKKWINYSEFFILAQFTIWIGKQG